MFIAVISSIIFRNKLDSDTVKLGKKAKPMLGKNVEIVIREIEDPKPIERKWKFVGSLSLGKSMDNINIRDFADDSFSY